LFFVFFFRFFHVSIITQIASVELPSFRGIRCETVELPSPFPSSVDSKNIAAFVTGTHREWGAKVGNGMHDAVLSWVQWVSNASVRVCAAESGRHDNHHDNNVRLEVMVVAKGVESRAQVGDIAVPAFSGTVCKEVKFKRAFDKTPVIKATATHRHHAGNSPHEAMLTWVRGSSAEGFTVCAKNRHGFGEGHDRFSFEWIALPDGLKSKERDYLTGKTGVQWKRSGSTSHCQEISFPGQLSSELRASAQFTPVADFPVVAWGEKGTAHTTIVCIAPGARAEAQFDPSRVSLDYLIVSGAPNVKGSVPITCRGLTDGFHDLDLDDDDGTVATRMFCQGQKLVLGNFYNTVDNDFPDTLSYVVSGWRKLASGTWAAGARLVDPTSDVSQAHPPSLVQRLAKVRGWGTATICFKDAKHTIKECRSLSARSPSTYGTKASIDQFVTVAAKNGNRVAWAYARMAGMPASADKCYGITRTTETAGLCRHQAGCVGRTAGSVWWTGSQSNGFCEHATSGWNGVWHGWGRGVSYVPAEKDAWEYMTPAGPNAYGNTGFVLYLSE
jgi:hypothetical protein